MILQATDDLEDAHVGGGPRVAATLSRFHTRDAPEYAVHFTDYDTRLAAYAVIVDERRGVLLALWNEAEPPQWTMPGGGSS